MREDRHGRLRRTDGDRRRRPVDGFRARDRARFEDVAEDALGGLPARVLREIAGARLGLEDVPPQPEPADAGEEPELGRLELGTPRRLVLYRRPIELRAGSRMELADAVRDAAAEAVGRALGWPETDWEWDAGGD